jgi:spore germination cell wall hydrolase CwlJ-like protein
MTEVIALSRPIDGLRRGGARIRLRAASLWRAYPRETLGAGLLALVTAGAATISISSFERSRHPAVAPPAPPPLLLRQVSPDQAAKINAEIPVTGGPNPVAAPFQFKGSAGDRAQALNCLASAIYYEAGNQDVDGERAVAQVVLNRVRHPAFPGSVCGVVYQGSTRPTGCQFTFACDGSLSRQPDAEGWRRSLQVAEAALAGSVYAPVGWATHYHADYVVPYWASTMAKNAVVGAHLFYRWAGSWGQSAIFAKSYAGREPNAAALKAASLAVPHIIPVYGQSQLDKLIKEVPGTEPLKLSPSLRGDKRVAVRFTEIGRKAAAEAPHQDYNKTFAASDNLKWSLSSETVASDQRPLGRPAEAAVAAGASTSR